MSSHGAARGATAVAAAIVALPSLATSGASAQPAWIWPALIALVVVGLAVLAVHIAMPQQGEIAGERERRVAHDDRPSVFVVTREATPARPNDDPAAPVASAFDGVATPLPGAMTPPPGALWRGAMTPLPGAATPPPGALTPPPGTVLRLLSARLDEVTYEAGTPNVLSMTKRLAGEGAGSAPALAVRCARSDEGDDTVLSIEGSLDAVTAPALAPALEALVEERRRSVTLDLSGLRRLDGAGVAAIVRLTGRCRGFGGQVRVVGLGRQPRALFKLLRLDRFLQA